MSSHLEFIVQNVPTLQFFIFIFWLHFHPYLFLSLRQSYFSFIFAIKSCEMMNTSFYLNKTKGKEKKKLRTNCNHSLKNFKRLQMIHKYITKNQNLENKNHFICLLYHYSRRRIFSKHMIHISLELALVLLFIPKIR